MNDSHVSLLSLWNWHSPMWLVALAAIVAYVWVHRRHGGLTGQAGFFVAALAAFLVATVSPINRLAYGYLFSAHMVHHLLLLLVVPGFLLVSISPAVAAAALRLPGVARFNKVFSYPLLGWAMGAGAMWFWHVPTFCVASQTIGAVSDLQTASLLVLGLGFWSPICSPDASVRLTGLRGVAYLFLGCLACTALGIYLTFSPVSVCPSFAVAADPLGITPYLRNTLGLDVMTDQKLGGLLMWVPACAIYMVASATLLIKWFGRPADMSDFTPAPVK